MFAELPHVGGIVHGRNAAPTGMYKTKLGYFHIFSISTVQDFFHQ